SFFFQAEDGIRDFHVTGVQTCALPILRSVGEFLSLLKESLAQGKSTYAVLEDLSVLGWFDRFFSDARRAMGGQAGIIGNQMAARSEERRVGKAGRCRGGRDPRINQKTR